MLGMRVSEITAGIDLLSARTGIGVSTVTAIRVSHAAMPMPFATAFDTRIAAGELDELLASYQSAVGSALHRRKNQHALPGVLQHFEVADLVKAIAPRPAIVVRFVDPLGQAVRS